MKKNASSKILLSLGVATLLYSSAFAEEINLTQSSDVGNYFEENGKDIVGGKIKCNHRKIK
ncbi:hypothetical protein E7N55_05655 [Campylobacter jejuni]|nr:hypothetical protein [Campylobacter jejuni]